ncbi:MAG TPA: PP2C family serine/threonine-protein phosphatase [Actinomycetota bacterium]|nr:PP2C family serine/threonine-protein phosphatase [Actinomycetota bacterium]
MGAVARVITASVVGSAHITASLPCQDAVEWFADDEYVHVAVADGLGSAEFSAEGAAAAVKAAVNSMRENASDSKDMAMVCFEAIAQARAAVNAECEQQGCEPRDMACTLIIAILHEGTLATSHIGDGGAVALTMTGTVMASYPGDSEYVNEVDHLCMDSFVNHIRTAMTPDVVAFAVFTDGIQRAVLRKEQGFVHPYEGFFEPIFDWASNGGNKEELVRLLQGKKLNDVSDDDKTLAVVATIRDQHARL